MNASHESAPKPETISSAEMPAVTQWEAEQSRHRAEQMRIIDEDPSLCRIREVATQNPDSSYDASEQSRPGMNPLELDKQRAEIEQAIINSLPRLLGETGANTGTLQEIFQAAGIPLTVACDAIRSACEQGLVDQDERGLKLYQRTY